MEHQDALSALAIAKTTVLSRRSTCVTELLNKTLTGSKLEAMVAVE
jgi:hypothetical protein